MKLLIAISFLITLTSCLTVSFNQPQPKDGKRLQEFPEELQGTWKMKDGDFLTIDDAKITLSKMINDSLNNVIDTSYNYTNLSDTIRMYRGGNFYVYNVQSSNGSWLFALAKVDSKGNIYNYLCDDFMFYAKLKGLKADSASYQVQHYIHETDELNTLDTTIYHPSVKVLSKIANDDIRWVYFDGQIRISDLRKIAIRKNLISIYKVDGTVEEIEED